MSAVAPAITLRPARREDEPFLLALYATTRELELSLLPWGEEEKTAFVRSQFAAQDESYRTNYRDASFDVIEVDGEALGRLCVARWEGEIRVLDITLHPQHRGAGIGTLLLRGLLAEAAENGRKLSLHVELNNPALRLYERLGFRRVDERGPYLLLEVTPDDD
jgi:ribosomal protein S18 acetylase RimI-like enzyme